MVDNLGKEETIFESYRTRSVEVLNQVSKQYPTEVWQYVSKRSERKGEDLYDLIQWLRGDWGIGRNKAVGALTMFDNKDVWSWVDEAKKRRAAFLGSMVPKILFRKKDDYCWARQLLIRYGELEEVRRSLGANFSTGGFSGPASLHHTKKKERLKSFLEKEKEKTVISWVQEYIKGLDERIKGAKIREERSAFGF